MIDETSGEIVCSSSNIIRTYYYVCASFNNENNRWGRKTHHLCRNRIYDSFTIHVDHDFKE